MSDEVTQTAWEVDTLLAWFRDQQLPQPIADDAVRIVQDAIAQARREGATEALEAAADAWLHGAWGDTPRRSDRVADRMAASQYAGDWLRARAKALRGDA